MRVWSVDNYLLLVSFRSELLKISTMQCPATEYQWNLDGFLKPTPKLAHEIKIVVNYMIKLPCPLSQKLSLLELYTNHILHYLMNGKIWPLSMPALGGSSGLTFILATL